jgi:hypothetical protein
MKNKIITIKNQKYLSTIKIRITYRRYIKISSYTYKKYISHYNDDLRLHKIVRYKNFSKESFLKTLFIYYV